MLLSAMVNLLARLPFWLLYRVSDLLFVVVYRLIRYRKRIVLENLRNAYPESTPGEIDDICRKYYRYFCDLVLETFKTLTISPEQAMRRVAIRDWSVIDQQINDGRDVILVLGHYCNWELAGAAFGAWRRHQMFVIYKPLANPVMDRLINTMRTRSGTRLIPIKETVRQMEKNSGTGCVTAFIADQSPPPDKAHWMTFLNQDTPVFLGAEGLARRFDQAVVFLEIRRIKRGFYEMFFELLTTEPRQTADGEITEAHTRKLESVIREEPEFWIWSHRRWKHKRPSA